MLSKALGDPNLFAKIIIFMYVCSSIRYGFDRDWGRLLYWIAAAMITFSVTFMMKH